MNILVNGIQGFMGREVKKCAENGYEGAVLLGGIDLFKEDDTDVLCAKNFDEAENMFNLNNVDCVIDFSNHVLTKSLLQFCVKHSLPVVIATTGHDESELELIKNAAQKIPVFHSANMSLGVALLVKLAKVAAGAMKDADIEIIEKHHNRKVDAPSGTAMMLYRELNKVREDSQAVFGRGGIKRREKNEIGIHAVRMGNIVGEHEVILCTPTQSITLKHEAYDRALFAEGAIVAAKFLMGRECRLYSMNDIVNE